MSLMTTFFPPAEFQHTGRRPDGTSHRNNTSPESAPESLKRSESIPLGTLLLWEFLLNTSPGLTELEHAATDTPADCRPCSDT